MTYSKIRKTNKIINSKTIYTLLSCPSMPAKRLKIGSFATLPFKQNNACYLTDMDFIGNFFLPFYNNTNNVFAYLFTKNRLQTLKRDIDSQGLLQGSYASSLKTIFNYVLKIELRLSI